MALPSALHHAWITGGTQGLLPLQAVSFVERAVCTAWCDVLMRMLVDARSEQPICDNSSDLRSTSMRMRTSHHAVQTAQSLKHAGQVHCFSDKRNRGPTVVSHSKQSKLKQGACPAAIPRSIGRPAHAGAGPQCSATCAPPALPARCLQTRCGAV